MIQQNYSIAISETLEILKHTKQEDIDKIPKKFLKFLEDNASNTYSSTLDFNKPLREMQLNEKTIGLLSIINRKYWLNSTQRKQFDEKLKENENIFKKNVRIKYNPDNNKCEKEKNSIQEEREMIEYNIPKWYQKLFNKIKNIFIKKHDAL